MLPGLLGFSPILRSHELLWTQTEGKDGGSLGTRLSLSAALDCLTLLLETKEKERLSTSPGAQKDEGEVAPKRPRLNRDFKPFDYAGSKFTEFTKGQSVEVSVLVMNMGIRVSQSTMIHLQYILIIHYHHTPCNIIIGTLPLSDSPTSRQFYDPHVEGGRPTPGHSTASVPRSRVVQKSAERSQTFAHGGGVRCVCVCVSFPPLCEKSNTKYIIARWF